MSRLKILLLAAAVIGAASLQPATAQSPPASGQQGGQVKSFLERFRAANTTHDGKLTLPQAEAANMPGLARAFPQIDAQHKGFITLEDIRTFIQKRRASAQPAATQ